MLKLFAKFFHDLPFGNWKGQDMAEYGLLVGFIAILVAGVVTLLGVNLNEIWTALSEAFADIP